MATQSEYLCLKCGEPQWPSLFQALFDKANDGLKCPKPGCKGEMEMQLTFSFGLHGKVVGAFCPDPDDINEWEEKGESWEFYPFLVIIESMKKSEPGLQVWQPYWHKVTAKDGSVRTPYGQWASCLDMGTFQQLLSKAKKRGI